MSLLVVVATGCATGVLAALLTGWMTTLAATTSRWLHCRLHVVLAGAGGAAAAATVDGWAELVTFALLALGCALLVVIDLASRTLPDRVVLPLFPVLVVGLTVAAVGSGDWSRLGRAALAAVALGLVYLALALIVPAGLGLGDVKLSVVLGAGLGWLGWSSVLTGTLAAFVVNGLAAAFLLLVRRVRLGGEIPFGPSMVVGAIIGGWIR